MREREREIVCQSFRLSQRNGLMEKKETRKRERKRDKERGREREGEREGGI